MILVTGATGYLGKAVAEKLRDKEDISIISRKPNSEFKTTVGSISDYNTVQSAMKNADAVIHLAAENSHFSPWSKHYETTIRGTHNIFKAAEENSVERVVHMSSAAVTTKHKTNYCTAKEIAEKTALEHQGKMTVPIIRASMIYDADKFRKMRGLPWFPFVYKKQLVHLSHRNSVAQAAVNALYKGKNNVYHVADKEPILLTEMYSAMMRGKSRPRFFFPDFPMEFGMLFLSLSDMTLGAIDKRLKLYNYLRYVFEDRAFDNRLAVEELKYTPVDTIQEIREIFSV